MNTELLTVIVTKKSIETADIASFELAPTDETVLPVFTAGSHIDVHIDGGYVRQYSLCNAPEERHRYLLGVLKEQHGSGGSAAMHEGVKEGDLLQISPPRNTFHLNEIAAHSLLLAGGIGVTPILAMAHRLAKLGSSFEMHYCTRSRERCAFYDMLKDSSFSERVHFHFDDGPPDQFLDIPGVLKDRRNDANLYVCGPKGFMEAVIGNAEKNWPSETVHREYFSADPQAGYDDDESFEVQVKSTGEVFHVPADKTIVETLEAHGIRVPVSCEQGICGTCITGVLEGIPDHRDEILTEEEQDANDQMTVCCSRAKSKRLVLDL